MFDLGTFHISLPLVIYSLLFIFAIVSLNKALFVVPDGRSLIIERLGKRNKVLLPGVNVIIPFLDKPKKNNLNIETILENGGRREKLYDNKGFISMAEHRMDPPILNLIAKDNSEINVNAVAYFRVIEPFKIVYDIANFADSFVSLVETTLRQEVAKLDSDTIISSRDVIGERLRSSLQEAGSNWGISIIRVEIEEITFDDDVSEQLSEARKQELIRRAEVVLAQQQADKLVIDAEGQKKSALLIAQGEKEAAILVAEGEKQAQILRAQGSFEEQKLQAEAKYLLESKEQEGVAAGYSAIVKALSSKSDAIVQLEALKAQANVAKSLGQSQNSLIIPAEAAGLIGAISTLTKSLSVNKQTNRK